MKLDNTVIKQKAKPDLIKSEIFFGIKIIAVASLFFILNSTDAEANTKKHYKYWTKKERIKTYPFAPIPGKYNPRPGLFDFDIRKTHRPHTSIGGNTPPLPPDTISPTPPDTILPTPPDTISPTPPDTISPTPPDTISPTPPDTISPTPPDTISPTPPLPPSDRDGDGVIDKKDKCPDDFGLLQFHGCPDTDGDGIIDKKDKCPDLPGLSKFHGCPDTDGDGVMDSEDKCPKLPGTKKNQGCPKTIQVIDTDGDGILDYEDECPEDMGLPENKGCPDTDGDGIVDKDDECPDLPGLPKFHGCPDTDGDGVIDPKDLCPYTQTVIVDQYGCPIDSDGDGYTDDADQCPDEYGPMEYMGCPVPPEHTRPKINQDTLPEVDFDMDRYELSSEMGKELDKVIAYLLDNTMMDIRISVFTDPRGTKEHNQVLTEERTKQIKKYLVYNGISAERIHIHNSGFQGIGNNDKDKLNLSRRVIIEPFFVLR